MTQGSSPKAVSRFVPLLAKGWLIIGLFVAITVCYGVVVLAVGVPLPLRPSFDARPLCFQLHIACGGVSLVVGILQFSARLRRRFVQWHRRLGILYLVMVLISGSAGFLLSFSAATGTTAAWGFRLLSVFWIVATCLAYFNIVRLNIARHREWMIRSYALTLAAVSLRIELPIGLMATGGAFDVVYPVIAYACWIPNLVIAEGWIRLSRRTRG
jgi:uncharacterized membrane protein